MSGFTGSPSSFIVLRWSYVASRSVETHRLSTVISLQRMVVSTPTVSLPHVVATSFALMCSVLGFFRENIAFFALDFVVFSCFFSCSKLYFLHFISHRCFVFGFIRAAREESTIQHVVSPCQASKVHRRYSVSHLGFWAFFRRFRVVGVVFKAKFPQNWTCKWMRCGGKPWRTVGATMRILSAWERRARMTRTFTTGIVRANRTAVMSRRSGETTRMRKTRRWTRGRALARPKSPRIKSRWLLPGRMPNQAR